MLGRPSRTLTPLTPRQLHAYLLLNYRTSLDRPGCRRPHLREPKIPNPAPFAWSPKTYGNLDRLLSISSPGGAPVSGAGGGVPPSPISLPRRGAIFFNAVLTRLLALAGSSDVPLRSCNRLPPPACQESRPDVFGPRSPIFISCQATYLQGNRQCTLSRLRRKKIPSCLN